MKTRVQQNNVKLVALRPLPYQTIRMPGEQFSATQGYADFFLRKGLARPANVAEGGEPAILSTREEPRAVTRELKATTKTKKPRKGTYKRRDKRAED